MEFDWLEAPFDLRKVTPNQIEESFEDPFSLRLLPSELPDTRYFNLGKSVGDKAIFSVFWTDGKKYRVIHAREMTKEEFGFYERKNLQADL
jgi:uncharacterized DUF497 family protein